MLSPASLESVSKKIARQWYNTLNISDNRAVAIEQMKKRDVVEQILQQQEYTYLPTYDYSTKPTTTFLETFSTNKIEKATQTNSRICILWNKPQIETKTSTKTEEKSASNKGRIGCLLLLIIAAISYYFILDFEHEDNWFLILIALVQFVGMVSVIFHK